MALSSWTGRKPDDPREPEKPDQSSNYFEDPDSSGGRDQSPKFLTATREARVERVSVFPEDGRNGKPCFAVSLELDSEPDPSNRFRRTERVLSLDLEIEEKELIGFARLAGRNLIIHYSRRLTEVQTEALQIEISRLQEENQRLRKRKDTLEEQLQFAIDHAVTS